MSTSSIEQPVLSDTQVDSITNVKQQRREQYLKNKQNPEWVERKRVSAKKYYLNKKINQALSKECKTDIDKTDDRLLDKEVKEVLVKTLETLLEPPKMVSDKISKMVSDKDDVVAGPHSEVVIKDTLAVDGSKSKMPGRHTKRSTKK